MWNIIKKKLGEVRNSGENTKKRWVIGTSAICILLVIFFWFYYINNLIKPVNTVSAESSQSEFWPVFKNGLNIVIDSAKSEFNNFLRQITDERAVIIEK